MFILVPAAMAMIAVAGIADPGDAEGATRQIGMVYDDQPAEPVYQEPLVKQPTQFGAINRADSEQDLNTRYQTRDDARYSTRRVYRGSAIADAVDAVLGPGSAEANPELVRDVARTIAKEAIMIQAEQMAETIRRVQQARF